jgi:hypothetical protein
VKTKLTPPQLAVLRAARDGNLHRSESIGTLYNSYLTDTDRNVTRQADALARTEPPLIEIGERQRWMRPWLITNAGLAVLAEYEGK